jgi:uncharacterized membrane protein
MSTRAEDHRDGGKAAVGSNATLTVFRSQADAEAAIRKLARDGYDLGQVSMLGRDADSDSRVSGYLNQDGRGSSSAKGGVSWGGIRGMLVGSGFFLVPGIGSLVVAGPLLTRIVQSMGPMVGPDKLGAMADGLQQLGIPKDSIQRCSDALQSGKVVIIAEGSAMAMIHAREVFRRTPVEVIEQHVRWSQEQ